MYRFTIILLLSVFTIGMVRGQIPRSAYVLNTLGQTLSMIDLENQTVDPNVETVGLFTNQVVVRGENAYVVNSGTNDIQVIDLNTLNTTHTIDLGAGTNPWNMDFVNDSIAVATLLFTNQAVFFNVNSGQIVQTVSVGSGPEGVKYYNGKVYVTNTAFNGSGYDPGTVSVIDVNTFNVSTIDVGLNPQDLALDSQGHMLVCCTGPYDSVNARIDFIDTNTQTVVNSVPVDIQVTSIRVSSTDKVYLGTFASGVLVYDINSGVFERDINNPLPGGPGIAIDQQDNVFITDFATDSVRIFTPQHIRSESYLVGDGPISIALYEPNMTDIVSTPEQIPEQLILYQNYPNPFNPSTTIIFKLPQMDRIRLDIVDPLGRRVRTLVNGVLTPGVYRVKWDGRGNNGQQLSSGVYFYQLINSRGTQQTRRMVLIK